MKRTILILAILCGSQSIYGQPFIYGVNGYEGMVRINAATGERMVLLAEFPGAWLTSIAVSSSTSELIVGTETGTIFRSNMEATRLDTVLTGVSFDSLHAGRGGSPCGQHALAVDASEQKIYAMGHGWCGAHFISMNLDGSDLKWIGGVDEGGNHLAIHPETRRVYFSKWFGGTSDVLSKKLDGSDQETLITENGDIGGTTFDFEAGAVYWQNNGKIKAANLDGTDTHAIAESEMTLWSTMLLGPASGHLYYSTGDASSPLWRIRLDGSEKTQISQGGLRNMVIVPSMATSLSPRENVPDVPSLSQNYPNPFHTKTRISYQLPRQSLVELTVYDKLGREIAVLDMGLRTAGPYVTSFDASGLSSGFYLYRLQAGDYAETKRMAVVR